MNIPVKVYAVLADPNTEAQVLVLKDERDEAILPIWIGASEANSIRLAMEKITIPRPLTHDLFKEILTYLNIRLEKVVINDVQNNAYHAMLYLERSLPPSRGGLTKEEAPTTVQVDARPSDAIALSLRYGTPLYVAEEVLNKKDTNDGFSEWLSRIRPQDFGSSSDA